MVGLVQSVIKGYQMLGIILAALPVSIQALFQLALAFIALGVLVKVIYNMVGGS